MAADAGAADAVPEDVAVDDDAHPATTTRAAATNGVPKRVRIFMLSSFAKTNRMREYPRKRQFRLS